VPRGTRVPTAMYYQASPGVLRALGTRLVAGRDFTEADRTDRPSVAIVNEAFARRFWTARDPVGERIRFLGEEKTLEIVGVVSTHKNAALTEPPQPAVFMPLEQWPLQNFMVAVRVDDPATAAASIEAALVGMPDAPRIGGVQPYSEVLEGALFGPRLGAALLGAFHGVMAYNVRLRTREIGIRMALGARSMHVFRRILADAMLLVVAGIAVGILGGMALEVMLADLLFEVPLGDPVVFGGAALVLVVLAGLAAALPAREATRVDPMVAMRHA
jgi:putative ABC transport system permease protein